MSASLGKNDNDISFSTNALKHLEYDRLKVTPRVSSKSYASHTDEEELHATSKWSANLSFSRNGFRRGPR